MARVLKAPWIAVYVTGLSYRDAERSAERRALGHLHLAEQLGGSTAVLDGLNPADTIISYARRQNITRIIIGKKRSRRIAPFLRPDIVSSVISESGHIDVYVIQGTDSERREEAPPLRPIRLALRILVALLSVGAATLLSGAFGSGQGASASVVTIYLAAAFAVSLAFGWVFGVGVSILSVLAFNFFFTQPYRTLEVSDPSYVVTFGVMAVVSIIASSLAARLRRQAEISRSREHRTHVLYSLSRQLSAESGIASIVDTGRRELERLCGEIAYVVLSQDVVLASHETGEVITQATLGPDLPELGPADRAALVWCLEHGEPYGSGTKNYTRAGVIALPISGSSGTLGAVLIRPRNPRRAFLDEERSLLETMTSQIALALQREQVAIELLTKRTEIESERVKSTLLRGISHDLRTPLATIVGSSSTLLQRSIDLSTTRELLNSIYEEATWMNRIVENMLNLTRIEAGNLVVHAEPETIDDLVTSAVNRVTRNNRRSDGIDHRIDVILPEFVLLANMDLPLMQQVVVNLLDNAMAYTEAQTAITVRVEESDGSVRIHVEDEGPGFASSELPHVFEKFFRGAASRNVRGSGLGLAISQTIVNAHGGAIQAENRERGGAKVTVTLPLVRTGSRQAFP